MALTPSQIAELLKMRALGFNQAEIADALNTSQQVIAYQLKKLKEQARKKGTHISHWERKKWRNIQTHTNRNEDHHKDIANRRGEISP